MANPIKTFVGEWKNSEPGDKAYMGAGGLFLSLAIVGVIIPVLPQVPFAVIAAFLFSRGSPRLHRWIRRHKYLGPPVKDWEEHRVVRPKLKVVSTVAMLAGAAIGHWQLEAPWFWWLDGIFALSILFLLTRKSEP